MKQTQQAGIDQADMGGANLREGRDPQTAPEFDLDTPLYSREALAADRARREAAAAAFRNEKAHERPPRHQA